MVLRPSSLICVVVSVLNAVGTRFAGGGVGAGGVGGAGGGAGPVVVVRLEGPWWRWRACQAGGRVGAGGVVGAGGGAAVALVEGRWWVLVVLAVVLAVAPVEELVVVRVVDWGYWRP